MNNMQRSIYMTLYNEGQKVLDRYNPCKITKLDNGRIACVRCPDGHIGSTFCCGGCQYLGPDGCTVKALGCKLNMCYQDDLVSYNERFFPRDMLIALDTLKAVGRAVNIRVAVRVPLP